MGQGTGQRIQLLTFSGSVYVNTKAQFNSSNGVPVQTGSVEQQITGDSTDSGSAVPDRDTSATAATGTITYSGQPSDTETIILGSKTYTFQSSLTNVDGNVLIGASADDTYDNLVAAVTLGGGAGSTYAAATTDGEQVMAERASNVVTVTADIANAAGNNIPLGGTASNATLSGSTLSGGTDPSDNAGHFKLTATTS